MYNRRYDKKFFMLRQEKAGFSIGQKTAWGSCILEIKNSKAFLTTRIQGLKPMHNNNYHIYLIGKSEEVVFCEQINLDNDGCCESDWEFSPDFIHPINTQKSITIEDISGILIIINKNGENFAPLVAYIEDKIEWKNFFIPASKEIINETISQPVIESNNLIDLETKLKNNKNISPISDDLNENIAEKIPENIDIHIAENATATKPKIFNFNFNSSSNFTNKYENIDNDINNSDENSDENYHGNFSALIKKFRKDLKELTEEGIFTKKDLDKIHNAGNIGNSSKYDDFSNSEELPAKLVDNKIYNIKSNTENAQKTETVQKIQKSKNSKASEKSNPLEYIEQRLKRFETDQKHSPKRFSTFFMESKKVAPFTDKSDMWNCITLDEMILIPSFPIEWQRKFFFLYPMKQFNHFLYKEINGVNYLAVPSHKKYIDDDQKEATELGFSNFLPIDNSDFGYWIYKK